MPTQTLTELLAQRRAGEITAVEVVQAYLDRIEQHDGALNSFITVNKDQAVAQAKQADAQGSAAPLAGLPIAYKDNICTEGVLTSAASKMLANFTAPYQATLAANLANAGAVNIGKTNMDEFALGSTGQTSFYGATQNPWDTTRSPGGSSSGSAAAVAAGLVPAAIASDTGGSIRHPAAHCGITGIKPTYGRVSRYGLIAAASSFDQAGVMARTAEDCAHVLQAMAGYDAKDTTSVNQPVDDYVGQLSGDVKGLTIGLPKQLFTDELPAAVKDVLDAAIAEYKALGTQFVELDLAHLQWAHEVFQALSAAEFSSNMSRFDGVRFGYRCENPKDLEDMYLRSRSEGLGDEVKRRILLGAYVLSGERYENHYRQAQRIRQLIHDDFAAAFKQVDLLLAPVTETPAVTLGEGLEQPAKLRRSHRLTQPANLAGVPAMSVPAGFVDGLPVGLQLIAPWFAEGLLLNVAHAYQQVTDWHRQQPAKFAI